MEKEITLKEAQEHIKEWGIDSDNFIQKNYQQFLTNGEYSDNTIETHYYHNDRLKIVVEAGLKATQPAPPVMEYKPETQFEVDGTLVYNLRENLNRRINMPEMINDVTISLGNNHHLNKRQTEEIARVICDALNKSFLVTERS